MRARKTNGLNLLAVIALAFTLNVAMLVPASADGGGEATTSQENELSQAGGGTNASYQQNSSTVTINGNTTGSTSCSSTGPQTISFGWFTFTIPGC